MNLWWKSIIAFAAISLTSMLSLRAADSTPATQAVTGQHAEKLEKGLMINYLLYLPPDYATQPDKKWPVILFLHGSGERGTDINKVKAHGPPKIVETEPDSALAKQFIVISPQCSEQHWWKSEELLALLDDVMPKYHTDADRLYLTGLSMGGYGTWALATIAPERFAAIVPMCGGGTPAMAGRLKDMPIWVFHGDADKSVDVQRSIDMVDALKAIGSDVKFTKYAGVGHNCWTQSYANPELYTWLLSHKRGEKHSDAKLEAPLSK